MRTYTVFKAQFLLHYGFSHLNADKYSVITRKALHDVPHFVIK